MLYNGDCLIESDNIKDGTVDLILTDLPYGTIKSFTTNESIQHGLKGRTTWDNIIDVNKIMEIANRVLRMNGKMVLFANQPFTTELISKAIPNLPHCYNMYWDKKHFANCLTAKKAPVSYVEDILVFTKIYDTDCLHPLRVYFQQIMDFIGLTKKQIINKIGQKVDHVFRFNTMQFSLCTEQSYNDLITTFNVDGMFGFKTWKEIKNIDDRFSNIFNLWESNKVKSNLLEYKKDFTGHHPTQKPVLLLEDLIKTFSNKDNLVVDLTMGSGSTGVACVNTNRNFIGIELDKGYFDIATNRINDAIKIKQRELE